MKVNRSESIAVQPTRTDAPESITRPDVPADQRVDVKKKDTLWALAAKDLGPNANNTEIQAQVDAYKKENPKLATDVRRQGGLLLPGDQLKKPPLPAGWAGGSRGVKGQPPLTPQAKAEAEKQLETSKAATAAAQENAKKSLQGQLDKAEGIARTTVGLSPEMRTAVKGLVDDAKKLGVGKKDQLDFLQSKLDETPNQAFRKSEINDMNATAAKGGKVKQLGQWLINDASKGIDKLSTEQKDLHTNKAGVMKEVAAAGGAFMGNAVLGLQWAAGQAVKGVGAVIDKPSIVQEVLKKEITLDDVKAAGKGIAAIPGAMVDSTSQAMEDHGVAAAVTQLGLNVATLGMVATKARALSGAGRTAEAAAATTAKAAKPMSAAEAAAEAAKEAAAKTAADAAKKTADEAAAKAAQAAKKTAPPSEAQSGPPPRPPQAFMDSVSKLQEALRANASTKGATAQEFLDALGGKGQARSLLGKLRNQDLSGLAPAERAVVEHAQRSISTAMTVLRDSEGPGSIPSQQWEAVRAEALRGAR